MVAEGNIQGNPSITDTWLGRIVNDNYFTYISRHQPQIFLSLNAFATEFIRLTHFTFSVGAMYSIDRLAERYSVPW